MAPRKISTSEGAALLSIIHGLASLRESELLDPRETESFRRPEIEKLFALALAGRLPRTRELKPWEPAKLNERHIVMITMRAGGLHQRQIAHAIGDTEAHVSICLNHPDSELLLAKLQAMKAMEPSGIEQRLMALTAPATETLERLFASDSEVSDLKKAPMAFKLLELNGHGAKRRVEHDHRHELRAAPEQLERLTTALQESRQIQDAVVLGSSPLTEGPPQGQELAPATAPSSSGPGEDS